MKKHTGMILAAAVGTLFATATFADDKAADGHEGTVKCAGANACKGQSVCKTADNACKGQNSCKGKGWIHTKTDKECTDKGGKVEKS
jgi:hypothetical protein